MYLSSSGGGSGGPRPSSDLKDDGCPGDRGNEALLSDVDLNRVAAKVKDQELLPSEGLPRSPCSPKPQNLPRLLPYRWC